MFDDQHISSLRLRFAVSTFALGLSLLAGSVLAQPESFFASEEDFLTKAEAGWVKIAEGVYEKREADGEIIRRGFGAQAIDFFLESAQQKRQELLDRGPQGDLATYLKILTDFDQRIETLLASKVRAAETRDEGVPAKAACSSSVKVGIGTGIQCSPTFGGGLATASVFYTDFGPCNIAVATATASGTPGTYQHEDGVLACYQGRSASASCIAGISGCDAYAFASIDFVSCDLYQVSESFQHCTSGSIGGL